MNNCIELGCDNQTQNEHTICRTCVKRAVDHLISLSKPLKQQPYPGIILSPSQYDWMKAAGKLPSNAVRGSLTIPGYSRGAEKGNEWYWAVGGTLGLTAISLLIFIGWTL